MKSHVVPILLIFIRLDNVQAKSDTFLLMSGCGRGFLCCLRPGDLEVRKNKNLSCSNYLENGFSK